MPRRTAYGPRLTEKSTPEGNVVDARANLVVPTSHDYPGRQMVLVVVTDFLKGGSSSCNGGRGAAYLPILRRMLKGRSESEVVRRTSSPGSFDGQHQLRPVYPLLTPIDNSICDRGCA